MLVSNTDCMDVATMPLLFALWTHFEASNLQITFLFFLSFFKPNAMTKWEI